MNRKKKNNTNDVDDEVEELLRAAQDAALLKLTLNSHTVHALSSDLHPDLDQRFLNLKTGSKSKTNPESLIKKTVPLESAKVKDDVDDDDDDLLLRFAALKASIPKPPTSASSLVGLYTADTSVENGSGANLVSKDIVEDDEEDEVEKVIRWAMDAARLDPSPSSDEDSKTDEFDDSEKSDEDADSPRGRQKGKRK